MSSFNPLKSNLEQQLQQIMSAFGESSDMSVRTLTLHTNEGSGIKAALTFIEGMIDSSAVQHLISHLLEKELRAEELYIETEKSRQYIRFLLQEGIAANGVDKTGDVTKVIEALLSGEMVMLLENSPEALIINVSKQQQRSISEPSTETIIRGPREGFIESIRINTVLLRQRLKSEKLWIESREIGTITKTKVEMLYLKGIADDKTIEEVRSRLNKIEIDGVLESGYIEEYIQDDTYTPFPTIFNTERPDVVAAELLEGRIAIMVDGTPFALIVPSSFIHYFQAAEDYYHRADISSLIRLLRYAAFFIALLGPSVYIAITTFHHEMIPTTLLLSLSTQREGVPFPAFIEAVLMEIAFEILREAGIRMPRAVGQAVSIVGTLVIGTAAVDAGIVSAAMVIVVSITAISSFVFPAPEMSGTIRMIRFPMMILAATFGLFGIIIGIILLVFHLASLRSFGVPYLAPFGPFIAKDLKDSIIRVPIWFMKQRPTITNTPNKTRNSSDRDLIKPD